MKGTQLFIKVIRRNKQAFIGTLILLSFIVMATIGAWIVPLDLNPNYENRYRKPAFIEMILGTKSSGPDNDQTEIGRNPFIQDEEIKVKEEDNAYKDQRYLLGTDYIGRDIFAQIVHGSRDVLSIGFIAAILALFIGFSIGALSGFAGGAVDSLLMLITNLFLTISAASTARLIAFPLLEEQHY